MPGGLTTGFVSASLAGLLGLSMGILASAFARTSTRAATRAFSDGVDADPIVLGGRSRTRCSGNCTGASRTMPSAAACETVMFLRLRWPGYATGRPWAGSTLVTRIGWQTRPSMWYSTEYLSWPRA